MQRNPRPKHERKFEKTISLSFVLSLAIHGLFGGALVYENADTLRALTRTDKPVEVELVDAQKFLDSVKKTKQLEKLEGQIVQQDEKQLNDEVDEKTRFLSAHNQKVVRQEQAALNGKFKNSDDTGGEKKQQKTPGKSEQIAKDDAVEKRATSEAAEKESKEFLTSDDGLEIRGKKAKMKDFMPSFRPTAPQVNARDLASGGGEGASATDDHLKDVKTGMQTMLSTREFLYYSYYNRIRSKLTQYWQPKIREKMERIMKQGRSIASTGDKITRIVIVLDDKGILRKVQVLGTAGVSDLDDAAVEAFRAAAPFPNPPKGMVDGDGTIKIRWDFVLEA